MSEKDNLFDEMENKNEENNEDIADELEQVAKEESKSDSVFDYNALPDAPTQKYERVELDGQTVTIKEAIIEMPSIDEEWQKTLNGDAFFKSYGFKVVFDTENNDREYLSGLKGFKQDSGELSQPSLFREGKNQVAKLFKVYKKYVTTKNNVSDKEFDEKYGLKKFLHFLNSNPKAKITTEDIEFQGKIHRKNIITEFV